MLFSKNNPPIGFYVYAYLRDNGTPYYIGKGQNKRAWERNKNERFQPPKNFNRIVICESNLSEIGAFALERRLILWYGKKKDNTGILRNQTDGGEGTSGIKKTEEHIKKFSKAGVDAKKIKMVKKAKQYVWYHETGIVEKCTVYELRDKYGLPKQIGTVIRGVANSYKGWRLTSTKLTNSGKKNSRYDPKKRWFIHSSGILEFATRVEMNEKYNISSAKMCLLLKNKNRTAFGWKLL